jgi:solute carrier family 39 (zinc transporter), member 1/2/3
MHDKLIILSLAYIMSLLLDPTASVHYFKWLAALCILLSAFFAGWHLFKKCQGGHDHKFPLAKAFAAGVFLGAALLHMLYSASIDLRALGYSYPLAPLLAGGTFLILLWLEHLGREIEHHHDYNAPPVALLATLMLCFHALFEGMALGVHAELSTSIVLFAAIMAHKWAASFALACHLCTSEMTQHKKITLFGLFCLMTPAAIVITSSSLLQNTSPLLAPICNALAAGTFLYIGTLHGLGKAIMVERCCDLRQFALVILGFATMATLALWV